MTSPTAEEMEARLAFLEIRSQHADEADKLLAEIENVFGCSRCSMVNVARDVTRRANDLNSAVRMVDGHLKQLCNVAAKPPLCFEQLELSARQNAEALAAERVEVERLRGENAALVKQWNDLDARNEQRHREWNATLTAKDAEIRGLREALEKLVEDADYYGDEFLESAIAKAREALAPAAKEGV